MGVILGVICYTILLILAADAQYLEETWRFGDSTAIDGVSGKLTQRPTERR